MMMDGTRMEDSSRNQWGCCCCTPGATTQKKMKAEIIAMDYLNYLLEAIHATFSGGKFFPILQQT